MDKQPQEFELNQPCVKCGLKKREPSVLTSLLLDFAKNTTLHGLRYITERGLTIIEKTFWIVTFLVSLILCLFLINNVWLKWKTSPVIITINEHLVSVGEVPFPAVTVCPQARVHRKYYNYTAEVIKFKKMAVKWSEMKPGIPLIYETVVNEYPAFKDLVDVDLNCDEFSLQVSFNGFRIPNVSDHTLVQNIVKVSPKAPDVFLSCEWRSIELDCVKIFEPVLTNQGVCFTFNTLAADEIFQQNEIQSDYAYLNSSIPTNNWSIRDGYSRDPENPYPYFPRRGKENGAKPDLIVQFKERQHDQDSLCNTLSEGYKVFLSHPADQPQASMYYFAALPELTSSFALKITIQNTSETLASYSPQVRQCYFPGEFLLKYFHTYTPGNCRLECLADFTFQRCGCVWFHMPHSSGSVCSWGRSECVTAAIEAFSSRESLRNTHDNECQCLPQCTSITYDADVVKTAYAATKYMKINNAIYNEIYETTNESYFRDDLHDSTHSRIEIYFKEPRYVSMRRSELFGLTDFLANCGGLLGLFLGFSFLSLVEIFYFCTLRWGCKHIENKKINKKGNKSKVACLTAQNISK